MSSLKITVLVFSKGKKTPEKKMRVAVASASPANLIISIERMQPGRGRMGRWWCWFVGMQAGHGGPVLALVEPQRLSFLSEEGGRVSPSLPPNSILASPSR